MRNRLVLASASPRRRELLALLGVPFEVQPSDVDETLSPGLEPAAAAAELAARKAVAVCRACADAIVLGADTLVVADHRGAVEYLAKPADADEAREMLRALSGATHTVCTGVAAAALGGGSETPVEADAMATRVRFRALSDAEVDAHIASGEPFDKAGGYGIQGLAAAFVEYVEGDYYNVIGLPVARVRRMLLPYFPGLRPAPEPPPELPFPVLPDAQVG